MRQQKCMILESISLGLVHPGSSVRLTPRSFHALPHPNWVNGSANELRPPNCYQRCFYLQREQTFIAAWEEQENGEQEQICGSNWRTQMMSGFIIDQQRHVSHY